MSLFLYKQKHLNLQIFSGCFSYVYKMQNYKTIIAKQNNNNYFEANQFCLIISDENKWIKSRDLLLKETFAHFSVLPCVINIHIHIKLIWNSKINNSLIAIFQLINEN